jgi:hypothetical protein
MYSYDRPSWTLWDALANALSKKGWTEEEIKDWLQSKEPRWALDGDLGNSIRDVGAAYADKASKVRK